MDPMTVILSVAGSLIVILLGVIGYLVDRGFSGVEAGIKAEMAGIKADIKAEMKVLWEKFDKHQILAESNAQAIFAHSAVDEEKRRACEERHKHVDEELVRLSMAIQQKE